MDEVQLPRFVGAKTPKEEALGLLRIAAEVEHALMVQYLYAAFSLPPEAEAAGTLVSVAIEEMGHLVTVENLLRLLGGQPHLDRDALLPNSSSEPIPFQLEPFSAKLLAKYMLVEAPFYGSLDAEIKARVDKATAALPKETVDNINRVGALYLMLYWLFLPSDTASGPWKDFDSEAMLSVPTRPSLKDWHVQSSDFAVQADVEAFQASQEEWPAVGDVDLLVLQTIDDKTALEALYRIAEQGEGTPGATGKSHFQRFLTAFEAAEAAAPAVSPLPALPNTLAGPSAIPAVEEGRIKTEAGLAWGRLFNGRYEILLELINLALRLDLRIEKEKPFRRRVARTLCLEEMRNGIRATSRVMLTLPQESPTEGSVPPPFELPAGSWPPDSETDIAQLLTQLRETIKHSGQTIDALRNLGDFGLEAGDHLDVLAQWNETLLRDL